MARTDKPSGTRDSSVYDGFISYSHAADDLLAPRLQAGLQRFAKPWWKRRALRLFRDEASLSANPQLWSSITEALDESAWFVLLMSPDAADSDWVNKELEYWKIHKDRSRILPVLTNGSFEWTGSDVSGSAVPEELEGVFSEEPRWVDLRFAKGGEQLDLKNPRFAAAVADVASALRGIPKDELESEEVRQHRRTLRTASAGGLVAAVLAAAAAVFGIQSANNARIAEENLLLAETKAADEEQARLEAERAAAEARHQAAIAESRRLSQAARTAIGSDPELAMLLALQAMRVAPEEATAEEATAVLEDALAANRLVARIPAQSEVNFAEISPDGETIYHYSWDEGVVRAIDVETRDVSWKYPETDDGRRFRNMAISRNGDLLAFSEQRPGDIPATVVLRAADGSEVTAIPSEGCPRMFFGGNITGNAAFSLEGRLLIYTGSADCSNDSPEEDWVGIYDIETWEEVDRLTVEGEVFERAVFSRDSTAFVMASQERAAQSILGNTRVLSYPGLEIIRTVSNAESPTMSPSGAFLAYADRGGRQQTRPIVRLLSLSTGETESLVRIAVLYERFSLADPISFSPDGRWIGLANAFGVDPVFVVSSAELAFETAFDGRTYNHSWTSDGSLLLTSHPDFLLLWSTADPVTLADTLSREDLIAIILTRITRGFTSSECASYQIHSPCPITLEEIQTG